MIPASSAFLTANAALNKQPILIAGMRGYARAFSSVALAGPLYDNLGAGGLVGVFTNGSGSIVGQPFAIGADPLTMIVPVGATQLQLGINDNEHADNITSFLVNVTAGAGAPVTYTVPGTAMPWTWVNAGLNTAFQFGWQDGTSPIVVSSLVAGEIVQIAYQSGTVSVKPGTFPFCDANGDPNRPTYNNFFGGSAHAGTTQCPTAYIFATIYPWLVAVSDHSTTVNELDGGVDLADLIFTVQDNGQAITGDFPTNIFEGKRAQLLHGYQGMNLVDYAVMFTGAVDVVASENANSEYSFDCASINTKKLSAKIFLTGDDGFPTDAKHPKTLNDHPINILVAALGQAGVPPTSIDTNKLYYYRDTIYAGVSFEFSLSSAPVAKDFIEHELMKPLGAYLRETNIGLLTANFFYPALSGGSGAGWSYTPPTPPVATLDNTNTVDMPLAGEANLVNEVTFRFDDDGTGNGKFLAESTQEWSTSIEKFGLVGAQIIESKGMRSAFQGFFWAQIIARLIFLRYGSKNLLLEKVSFFWSQCLLEPGDIIQLTIAQVPNRGAGTLGVTNMMFEVFDRNWKFASGQVELKLLAIDLSKFKQYLIAPNGEANYASDTPTNRAKYMYQCDVTDKYSTGAAANTLG